MADEDALPLARQPSTPPDDGGADDLFEFVETPSAELEAREQYRAECARDSGETAPVDEIEISGPHQGTLPSDPPMPLPPPGKDPADSDSALGEISQSIGPHLDELRRRLIIAAAAFVPAFIVGILLYTYLWDILLLPLADASPHLLRFQALSPSDGLILSMQIAFAFALIVSTPIWITQIWSFVAPGLTRHERRALYASLGSGGILFLLGVLAAYFYAVPLALGYLLPLNQSLTGWENSFTGEGYVGFVLTCCIAFGIAFELPLIMLVLGWIGLLSPEGIAAWWRQITLGIFVLAAVMTPPDPFSLLLLAIPMLGLFFLGFWLVKLVYKKYDHP